MAGNTGNVDILAGINQVIQAINDKEFTVNVTVQAPTSSGCGCCGGDEPPADPADQEGEPPEGFKPVDDENGDEVGPGDPFYDTRKCKVANLVVDELQAAVQALDDNNVVTIATLGVQAFTTVVLAVLAFLTDGLLLLFAASVGGLSNLYLTFVRYDIDLAGLVTIISTNREDLVCAMYSAVNAQVANTALRQVLEDGGATTGQLALYDVIVAIKTLNYLFFEDTVNQEFEQALDGYVSPTDCSVCDSCLLWEIPFGTLVADSMPFYIQLETVDTDTVSCLGFAQSSRAGIGFVSELTVDPCEPLANRASCFANRTVTAIRFVSGTFVPLGSECHAYINHAGGQTCHYGFPGTDWEGSISDVESVGVAGNVSGTFQVKVEFA